MPTAVLPVVIERDCCLDDDVHYPFYPGTSDKPLDRLLDKREDHEKSTINICLDKK